MGYHPDELLAHQVYLEKQYNKNQAVSKIRREFSHCREFNFKEYLKRNQIDESFGLDLLTQMVLHKRCNLPTMVGILRRHFKDAQDVADMILRCCQADLCDWSAVTNQLIIKFHISDDVQRELDKYQYPLPMVIEPNPVTNNKEDGYITSRGSLILKNNHHDEDICLDHINRVNKIKFVIDNDTATMIANSWRNLDKLKPGETKADFERRKRAFEKYDRTAKEVIQEVNSHHGPDGDGSFWLTHKYDKRGRVYCQGYHISYQSTAWCKAIIQLADKEHVL